MTLLLHSLRATIVAATALALLGVSAVPGAEAERALPPGLFDDSFYVPPTKSPASPGDILRWRPSEAGLNELNADAWQVMYRSTDAEGKPDAVTATILVPKNTGPEETPIVGFAPGTQGPAFKCAASKAIERGTFAAVGLDAAYPDLALDSLLNETGRAELSAAKECACVVELLVKYPFKKISDFTTRDPLPTPRWQTRLAENRLGGSRIEVPVFQYHARTNEIVNRPPAEQLRREYCAQGVELTWKTYISDHLTGIFAGSPDAGRFISDRLSGKPSESNC